MAYPIVDGPYGFDPVNLIGGLPFAGSTRQLPIAYNYNTDIFNGDLVAIGTSGANIGYVVRATYPVNTTNTTIGVFMGCSYTNPTTKQKLFSQSYPANTAAGDIVAYIADDPTIVLKTAATTAAGVATIGSVSSLVLGLNLAGNTLTGSVSTGNSFGGVVGAAATTASAGFRVVDIVRDTQISYPAAYVSGTGTTTLTVSGLTVGQVIPIGTDVFNVVNGQLQFTGSATTAAATVASSTSQALTVTASTVAVVGTLALVQTPEVLVKINFGAHRYNVV